MRSNPLPSGIAAKSVVAPPRRWRWWPIVLLGILILLGIAALGWNLSTWNRAVWQLKEAGFKRPGDDATLGQRWLVFDPRIWRRETTQWQIRGEPAGKLRNLDAISPALRHINPEVLTLWDCRALEDLNGLKGLTAIRALTLCNATALRDVDALADLRSLERLSINGCGALRDVNALRRLVGLRSLQLSGCPALINAGALKELTALPEIVLVDCPALETLDGLERLTELTWIDVHACRALKNIAAIRGLPKLGTVILGGCPSLPAEEIAALKAAIPTVRIERW